MKASPALPAAPVGAAPIAPTDFAAAEETIHRLADAARVAVAPFFRAEDLGVEHKEGGRWGFDPVTAADKAIETAIRDILATERPEDGVYGEEYGVSDSASGRVWVIDPIDGTRAFLCGLPLWGVLIALYDAAREGPDGPAPAPVLGVLDQPYLGERFLGARPPGQTPRASLRRRGENRALRTRACADLAAATLLTTTPAMFQTGPERAAYDAVAARARMERYGTDCYGYAMVAAGCADLVIEADLAPYDVQALIPLIEAAGGRVTDWRGGPAHLGGRVVAAGDPALHAKVLEILSAAP